MNENIPIEIVLDNLKTSIATYVNALAKTYKVPSTFMLYILQEIVDESKLAVYSSTIQKLQENNLEETELTINTDDIQPEDFVE